MTRTKIRLETNKEVMAFVSQLNTDGSIDKYVVEDAEGRHRVNARSYLGMLYASAEFAGNMFLVNETEDGKFPAFIYDFMPISENDGNYIHE
jgi:hypothetical protein